MKEELDKALCEKYPLIFANRYGNMQSTAMCWGFECGDGWYNIIDALCLNIQGYIDGVKKSRDALLKNNPYNAPIPDEVPQVVAVQVKEKFGGLRFYYDGGDERIRGMEQVAESMSTRTCETCGKPGKLITNGWWYTACEEHTHEEDKDETEE